MDTNIVSTTDLQRNMRQILTRLNDSNEPLIVVRDSKPEAVVMRYDEYRRISALEKEQLKQKMMAILADRAKRFRHISDKELDADIKKARRAVRRGRH